MNILKIIFIIIEVIGALWVFNQFIKAENRDKAIFYIFAEFMCVIAIILNIYYLTSI